MNIIENGYKIQVNSSKFYLPPVKSIPSKSKRISLLNEINRHISSGVVSEVEFNDNDIVSRVFNVPKSSGGNRMILDLSNLNKNINKVTFKLEDKEVIKSMIRKNDYFVSLDLKDAFHSISLHPDSRKFTTFEFEGKRYAYNVLPFGLTSSPRVFSSILKPVISHLRSSGIRITHYLDDILICSETIGRAIRDRDKTMDLLSSLGFKINLEKSSLSPSQKISHLGYLWDSVNMWVSLPPEKLIKIKVMARRILSNPCSIRSYAALLGLLVSSHSGYRFAPLHYRRLQLDFLLTVRTHDCWESFWVASEDAKLDLSWWLSVNISELSPVPILGSSPIISLFTDSSLSGWGAHLSSGEYTSGSWSNSDCKEHINFLELKAIYLAVEYFLPRLKGKSVLIRSDNSTTVFYLNKIGGTHSPNLCLLSLKIWELAINNSIDLIASHIAGVTNTLADYLSRHSKNHEYFLSSEAFEMILPLIPFKLDLDLFASSLNAKLPKYVSLFNDPQAIHLDAFSIFWPSNIYIFPPIPLMHKSLSKVIRDNVKFCLFITPAWSSMSILPILKNMLISNPIFIPSKYLIGYLPMRHRCALMGWPISGSSAKNKVSLQKYLVPSSKAFALQPFNHTTVSGQNLCVGLEKEKILPIFLPF